MLSYSSDIPQVVCHLTLRSPAYASLTSVFRPERRLRRTNSFVQDFSEGSVDERALRGVELGSRL